MEYPTSHLYFLGTHTALLFYTMDRKDSDQHNQYDIRVAHDGKVGCNTVKQTTAFLYSVFDFIIAVASH